MIWLDTDVREEPAPQAGGPVSAEWIAEAAATARRDQLLCLGSGRWGGAEGVDPTGACFSGHTLCPVPSDGSLLSARGRAVLGCSVFLVLASSEDCSPGLWPCLTGPGCSW